MSIDTPADLAGLQRVGAVVAATLRECKRHVRAGVTTAELDAVAARVFARHGARSGPQLDYRFPGAICISVNDEITHGIPGARRLRDGDLVKLDVTAELDGYYADACVTVAVAKAKPRDARLLAATQSGLRRGIEAARAGVRCNELGAAVEAEVQRRGFSVLRELGGHGIGRRIHEQPSVPNWADPEEDAELSDGLVIAIEPMVSPRRTHVEELEDGWTLATADGSRSAHFEHTVVVRRDQPPLILTA